jgi:hypothetical protein
MTQVIISDYVVERRMVLMLDASDFKSHAKRWDEPDSLLVAFKDHPFFGGCERWSDLNIPHFHALIINMLKICADHHDMDVVKPNHPTVQRLSFLICSLINLLQQSTGSIIDLLRVNRVGRDDVLYDYSARLDVVFSPPKKGLRVVIDNA